MPKNPSTNPNLPTRGSRSDPGGKRLGRSNMPKLLAKETQDVDSYVSASWGRGASFGSKHIRVLFVTIVSAGILGLGVAVLFLWKVAFAPSSTVDVDDRPSEEVLRTGSGSNPETLLVSSREIATKFLEASSVDEQLPLVREPGHEALMRKHWERFRETEGDLKILRPLTRNRAQDVYYDTFQAVFTNGALRLVCVVEDSDSHEQFIDWEAYARYGTASWDALLTEAADQAEVRVFLSPGYHFEGTFTDPNAHVCFVLTSADLGARVLHQFRSPTTGGPGSLTRRTFRQLTSPLGWKLPLTSKSGAMPLTSSRQRVKHPTAMGQQWLRFGGRNRFPREENSIFG